MSRRSQRVHDPEDLTINPRPDNDMEGDQPKPFKNRQKYIKCQWRSGELNKVKRIMTML